MTPCMNLAFCENSRMSSSLGSKLGSKFQKLEPCWESPFPSVDADSLGGIAHYPEATKLAGRLCVQVARAFRLRYQCRWIVDRNSTDNGSHLNGSRSSLITRKLLMFNQSKVVPTVLSTTPKMYIYPTKSQKSPLFTFQPILWRHSRFFPYLAEIGLEPRVKRHMENVLFPWQETIEGACGSSKLQNSHIYAYTHTCRMI